MSKHRTAVRIRAFRIWQKLGFLPWSDHRTKSRKGDFYKGAFDNIPFLNNDAKRTFVHLLLRPGHMIRDYIQGQHERYLAPLTSLIIFYAFFALVSSIVHPEYSSYHPADRTSAAVTVDSTQLTIALPADAGEGTEEIIAGKLRKLGDFLDLLSLDRHPEKVDTPEKASLAAFEGALRSQGVTLFLGQFLLLWTAMCLALRKRKMSASACAAAAAYILCQFCFFMFFSLFIPGGNKGEIGVGLMGLLLTVDYYQLFDSGWKKSLGLTLKTGLRYLLVLALLCLLLIGLIFLYFWVGTR